MSTSHEQRSSTSAPTPGTLVHIKEGTLRGLRGSVALMAQPEAMRLEGRNVAVFFDEPVYRFGPPTQLVWLKAEQVEELPITEDPWYQRFYEWLQKGGIAALRDQKPSTGEVLELVGLPDGFASQVRATKILTALGCEKVERLRGCWVWSKAALAEEANEPPRNQSLAALMLAINHAMLWILAMPAHADLIFTNLATVCARHNRPVVPEVARWTAQGGTVLEMLRSELRGHQISSSVAFAQMLLLGFCSGQITTGIPAEDIHKHMAEVLVTARRFRELDPNPVWPKRTPYVDGLLLSLSRSVSLCMDISNRFRRNGNEQLATQYENEAQALQWLIDCAGGAPGPGQGIPPMKDFGEGLAPAEGHLDMFKARDWARNLTEWYFESEQTPEAQASLQSQLMVALMQAANGDVLDSTTPTTPPPIPEVQA